MDYLHNSFSRDQQTETYLELIGYVEHLLKLRLPGDEELDKYRLVNVILQDLATDLLAEYPLIRSREAIDVIKNVFEYVVEPGTFQILTSDMSSPIVLNICIAGTLRTYSLEIKSLSSYFEDFFHESLEERQSRIAKFLDEIPMRLYTRCTSLNHTLNSEEFSSLIIDTKNVVKLISSAYYFISDEDLLDVISWMVTPESTKSLQSFKDEPHRPITIPLKTRTVHVFINSILK